MQFKAMHGLKPVLVLLLLHLLKLINPSATASIDQFIFNGFAGANLTLDGMASVTPDGLLVLTNGTNETKGHAFHPDALRFRRRGGGARSFSTTFVFAIIAKYIDLSSHGFSFFVAPSKNLSAALPGQFLGLLNMGNNGNESNHIFAVEFDTILNSEFQDINNNHVGVDVNGLHSLTAASAGYYMDGTGAFQNLSLYSRKAMQVWVEYDGQTTELNVTMAPAKLPKPKKPLLSSRANLSAVVTDTAYVGFSSSTGILLSNHYVLGWSFSLGGEAPAIDYTKLPRLPRVGPKPRSKVLVIALPVLTTLFVLAAILAALLAVQRRLRYAELREDWEVEFGPHRFAYKDLFRATDGFKDKQLLGVGGFGSVYRGVLPSSRTEVAVKRVSHESRQGMKQFIAEVVSLGRLRHRNLVRLLGYCRRKGELLLVYDYMPNGSLDKYLYGWDKPSLDWAQRFRIIKCVASGLLYLHEDWEQVIVHRDIKASNVLLDNEMNGRLGDFGLARLYDHGADPQTTHVVGTMGYLAPDLVHTGKATPLTDVFAFGAFVLEVVCGRRPVEEHITGQDDRFVLAEWVLDHWRHGSITDAVDVKLRGTYAMEEASLVLKLGLLCLHPLPASRPSMRQVVQYLDGAIPLPELPPPYMSFTMLPMMQEKGFHSFMAPRSPSAVNAGSMSGISEGDD